MPKKCPVCQNEVPEYSTGGEGPTKIECQICGTYKIHEQALRQLQQARRDSSDQVSERVHLWSAAIREQQEIGGRLTVNSLKQLDSLVSIERDPLASIDKIIHHVYQRADSANEKILLDSRRDYPIAYARGQEEFEFLLGKAVEMDYLEIAKRHDSHYDYYRLGIEGWKRVAELHAKGGKSNQAFVAMWFGEEMNGVYENGIKPALESVDYKPSIISMKEHNEKIDDQIIAEIRKSGLLVADFTGHRGNVYFEAGFAMGLGTPIIWTCREDYIEDLCFDTQQYNHVAWSNPTDLEEKLRLRIEATVPRQS